MVGGTISSPFWCRGGGGYHFIHSIRSQAWGDVQDGKKLEQCPHLLGVSVRGVCTSELFRYHPLLGVTLGKVHIFQEPQFLSMKWAELGPEGERPWG
jgi:hypothetical protein